MDSGKGDYQTIYIITIKDTFSNILQEALPGVKVVYLSAEGYKYDVRVPAFEEDESVIPAVEVLLTTPYILVKYVDKLVNLKWVHSTANGADALLGYANSLTTDPTFSFTKTHGSVNAPNTTEYVIGQIISRERHFVSMQEAQATKDWHTIRQNNVYRNMSDITIGVMGLGGIGQYLARQCKQLGMKVWTLTKHRRNAENRVPYVDEYRLQPELNEFLENCDYIVNVLPSTRETRHMLAGDVLKHCQSKGAVFINVGRGDIIDNESIIRAVSGIESVTCSHDAIKRENLIRNKWLGGAILDVFEKEPLPSDSPLWTLPGVTISPHISGWSLTMQRDGVAKYFIDNYRRYVRQEELHNIFDWKKGY